MPEIIADKALVAFCGLYCGACPSFVKSKCPGCAKNEKAKWCKVRKCCLENKRASCADCATVVDPAECRMLNNAVSKFFALFFRSDRLGCVRAIKQKGYDEFVKERVATKTMTIKK